MIEAQGHNGKVAFDGSTVTIVRKGGLARLTVGKGSKSIPVQHITGIQLKPAGAMVNGFIQFSMGGGNERRSKPGRSTTDAVRDENSVVFTKKQQPEFDALHAAIQARISDGAPGPSPVAPVDVAEQLGKLAALRDSGVLTEAEFAAQKAKLLA